MKFSALDLPQDWLWRGPTQFAAGNEPESLTGEVEEVWLENDEEPIADLLEERRSFLSRCFDNFEVLSQGPVQAGSPGAQSLTVRYDNDDLQPFVLQEVVLTEGPVRCVLRLSGPEDTPHRSPLFERIVRSFRLEVDPSLTGAENLALFKDSSPLAPTPGGRAQAETRPFPLLGHSFILPPGWDSHTEGPEVMLTDGRTQMRLRRLLALERQPATWISRHLEQLRNGAGTLQGCGQGSTPRGAFSALWIESGGGKWRTAATRRRLLVRLATEEPLEIRVEGSFAHLAEAEALLSPLICSLEPLASGAWQTRPLEPWIDMVLDGPWTSTQEGLYVHPELFIPMLELRRQEKAPPFETLKPSLHEALRQGAGVLPGSDQETAEMGRFQGREVWKYSADAQLSIRGLWIIDGPTLYTCLLQMRSPQAADTLLEGVMKGLHLESAQTL